MTILDDGSWLANPLAVVELGPGTVSSAGAREWTLEFGPLEFVERFSVTDRSCIWGPYDHEDPEEPIVIEAVWKGR